MPDPVTVAINCNWLLVLINVSTGATLITGVSLIVTVSELDRTFLVIEQPGMLVDKEQ